MQSSQPGLSARGIGTTIARNELMQLCNTNQRSLRLEGQGLIAITTHGPPTTLMVTPDNPVCTDPNATVAWSGSLQPEFKTDMSLKTFLGRGSGESLQMLFRGEGFVVIQPCEEVYFQQGNE